MECISLCAWHLLFVYFLAKCIYALSHVSLHQLDFFLEIFLWRLVYMFISQLAQRSKEFHVCILFRQPHGGDNIIWSWVEQAYTQGFKRVRSNPLFHYLMFI